MRNSLIALAFALAASAAFAQANVHGKKTDPKPSAGPIQELRGSIQNDAEAMGNRLRERKDERRQLLVQRAAELLKIRQGTGKRAEKKAARKVVLEKYARLIKEVRERAAFARHGLRDEIKSKHSQIQRLRQS